MLSLPVDSFTGQITDAVNVSGNVVVIAQPGAGKTTRVPPALLRAGLLSAEHPNLVMLQPRRVAARASAMRIAEENGWEIGREVGWHIRFENRVSRGTRLRVLTEGILTRQLADDPYLEGIGCVILDEFHERSLHTDIAIALLREIQQTVRPDLKIVVMSATLDAQPVAEFLGGAPIITVPGRTFPVEILYRNDMSTGRMWDRVADEVHKLTESHGDILVFLPGVEEIRRTVEAIGASTDSAILPLHGSLPADEQMRALRPSKQRKIILATNIAETSLTIDGVTTVIDTGYARVASFDPARGLDRLDLQRISQASAKQRAGRAGRTQAGRCIRLWSEKEQHTLEAFDLPEIRRVDLCSTLLLLRVWGRADAKAFGWFESPDGSAIESAERVLAMLGATDRASGSITEHGRLMLSLPVHPRLARLLVTAREQNLLHEGATLAAILSEKDFLLRSRGDRNAIGRKNWQADSDAAIRCTLLEDAERSNFAGYLRDENIDPAQARQVARTRDELLRIAERLEKTMLPRQRPAPVRADGIGILPLLAYPDRVARRRASDPSAGVMVGGGGVRLADESVVRQGELFVVLDGRHDPRGGSRELLVQIASRVEWEWLEELFPQFIHTGHEAIYDAEADRVIGSRITKYLDLTIREDRDERVAPELAEKTLRAALLPRASAIIRGDPAASALLNRMKFLRRTLPAHLRANDAIDLAIDDAQLLSESCAGVSSLRQALLAVVQVMISRLTYTERRILADHAPEEIVVPTGNRIALDWSTAAIEPQVRGPVLAVRLQEMFGLAETPRVAGGTVPVVLHLLGPNYRPVQVTSDLASFWKNTYPQVRKDLRARYPKHAWPDDPLTAPPQSRGRKRT